VNEALAADHEQLRRQNGTLAADHEQLRREYMVLRDHTETMAGALQKQHALQKQKPTRRAPQGPLKVLPDLGEDLRPDPRSAGTPAELMGCLRRFRTWAGNPSYRDMAGRSGHRSSASAMHAVLSSDDLPGRLAAIDAVVEGCGGTDEDRQRFATAWRRLALRSAPCGETARLLALGVARRADGEDFPEGTSRARSEPA
jgi:hypothetical protein